MQEVLKLKKPSFDVNYNGLYDNEYASFDMYFASICSMQVHPGAGTKEHKPMTIEQCKDMAMDMLKVRRMVAISREK